MYTMEDFERDYFKKKLAAMTPTEFAEAMQSLPLEKRLAGMSSDQIQEYLDQQKATPKPEPRKPRRKK